MTKDDIYPLYLEQLQGLQQFRQSYHGMNQTQALERDDPELLRLTEALAYCSAHSQLLGQRAIKKHQANLNAQIHPYMMTPLPAKTILQLIPTEKLPQRVEIKAGTSVLLEVEEGSVASFKTCRSTHVLPMAYTGLAVHQCSLREYEIQLEFRAFSAQSKVPGKVPVLLDVCQDVHQTLGLYYGMLDAEFSVSFDKSEISYPCVFKPYQEDFYPGMHPVESSRQQFHFPQAQFCIELDIPEAPTSWQYLNVHFKVKRDLLPNWQQDFFRPFCVPVINLQNAAAQRIKAEGTQARYPILPAEQGSKSQLHSVLGVYHVQQQDKRPLLPSLLHGALLKNNLIPSFGLNWDADRTVTLDLNLPQAFDNPCNIDIEAYWHQPEFSQLFWQKTRVTPLNIGVPGIEWQIAGAKRKCHQAISSLEQLQVLLALRSNEVMAPIHINTLVSMISMQWADVFEVIAEGYIGAVQQNELNRFSLHLKLGKQHKPLARLFLAYLRSLVSAWFAPQVIELAIEFVN